MKYLTTVSIVLSVFFKKLHLKCKKTVLRELALYETLLYTILRTLQAHICIFEIREKKKTNEKNANSDRVLVITERSFIYIICVFLLWRSLVTIFVFAFFLFSKLFIKICLLPLAEVFFYLVGFSRRLIGRKIGFWCSRDLEVWVR